MALTKEQLEIRKHGITGSEIASVAGLNPWGSPFDVYCSKKMLRDDTSFHTDRGNFLEPAIIRWYEHRSGRAVVPTGTRIHPSHKIVIATPDGESLGADGSRALEVKAPGWRMAHQFGDDGTDKIPSYYVPQVLWECAVIGVPSADFAALVDGDLRVYNIAFNAKLFDALREIAERFYRDHILADIPPPPDGGKKAREWLLKMYPQATHDFVNATEEMIELGNAYIEARDEESAAEKRKDEAGNRLRLLLKECEGAQCDELSITYSNTKGRVSYAALISELNVDPMLIAKHTGTGTRQLNVRRKG